MVVTTTPNKGLNAITVGTESGTWGPFLNSNETILDNSFGGVATIALTNANVVLSAAQYQCAFIVFTGALSGNCVITFPNIGSFYSITNSCTNIGAFYVQLRCGAINIGAPPGETVDIWTDGANNIRFRNLGRVGDYWDHGGTSVPLWVSACTTPPYLYCDGSVFNAATYPALNTYLGGNVLPDLRGRIRAFYNDGTGRITAAGGGVDGNTILAGGGVQSVTLSSQNLPSYNFNVNDPGHPHTMPWNNSGSFPSGGTIAVTSGVQLIDLRLTRAVTTEFTGITVNSGGSGVGVQTLPPMAIGGITMIRAG